MKTIMLNDVKVVLNKKQFEKLKLSLMTMEKFEEKNPGLFHSANGLEDNDFYRIEIDNTIFLIEKYELSEVIDLKQFKWLY